MTVGDDKELFEQILNDDAPAPEPDAAMAVQPEAEPETGEAEGGQPRDASGKFVAKAEDQPENDADHRPEAEPPPATEEPRADHRIPLTELLNEREKRQALERRAEEAERRAQEYERRMAELSRPKEPVQAPDLYADPNGFVQHGVQQALTPLEKRVEAQFDQMAQMFAIQAHGKEAVDAAIMALEEAVRANPATRYEVQKMLESPDRYGEVVRWHKRQQTFREIGDDPAAYRQRVIDEALKDPEVVKRVIEQARTSAAPAPDNRAPPNVRLPPSLNRASGAGGHAPALTPQTEGELFQELFSR